MEEKTNKNLQKKNTTSNIKNKALDFIINTYEKKWFKVFLVLSPILGLIGLTITTVALFSTLGQNQDLVEINKKFEQQNIELKNQYEKIQEIAKSVPTRYLDKFPNNFYELLTFLSALDNDLRSDRNLTIVKDAPAYGVFSNSNDFMKYRKKLKKIAGNGVTIEMVVYDSITRDRSMREQFSLEDEDFYLSPESMQFMKFLKAQKGKKGVFDNSLYDEYGTIIDSPELMTSKDDLFDIINLLSYLEVEKYKGWDISVYEVSEYHELFYWIIDGESAIFSLLNKKPINREASFMTYDNNFIEILVENFKSIPK